MPRSRSEAGAQTAPSQGVPSTRDGESSTAFSQSLERGLTILSSFTENNPVLGVADLARAVGLNKSTTHRYVATLAKLGYVQQDPETKRYSLGPRVVDLGFAAINSMEITRVAASYLQALSDETGYTVSMSVLDGPDIVYVDRRRSGRASSFAMGLHLHVGSRLPAYCTSMGKVLLAFCEPAELRTLLDRTDLARRGPKTITAREQLMAALARVRHSGIAVNDEELAAGLRSVAAPVRDRTGRVVAAVNIAIHLTVWNASVESVVSRLEGPLRHTVAEISERLGHRST
jgi:IclR family transcriptional regulator, pca regulon regulatory protein